MAKDKSEDPTLSKEKKEKKDKKDKKRKHSEVGDEPSVVETTPAKKEKKEKKEKRKSKTAVDLTDLAQDKPGSVAVDADGDVVVGDATEVKEESDDEKKEKKEKVKIEVPLAALVPFANPLCDEKAQKKVLKSVKKAAKSKALKRGVKECVKSIRKSPPSNPSTLTSLPPGIVILAADISPMDVISHIPVLCEDHNIPYLYVPSRAELGAAGSTKRPTSVVMITPKVGKGAKSEDEAEWEEAYKELFKLAQKLGQYVKV